MNSAELIKAYFTILKEMKETSTSYNQVAKKNRVFPPIKKICHKAGKEKLSDFPDEESLLKAIRDFVIHRERRKAGLLAHDDESESTMNDSKIIDNDGKIAFRTMSIGSTAGKESFNSSDRGLKKSGSSDSKSGLAGEYNAANTSYASVLSSAGTAPIQQTIKRNNTTVLTGSGSYPLSHSTGGESSSKETVSAQKLEPTVIPTLDLNKLSMNKAPATDKREVISVISGPPGLSKPANSFHPSNENPIAMQPQKTHTGILNVGGGNLIDFPVNSTAESSGAFDLALPDTQDDWLSGFKPENSTDSSGNLWGLPFNFITDTALGDIQSSTVFSKSDFTSLPIQLADGIGQSSDQDFERSLLYNGKYPHDNTAFRPGQAPYGERVWERDYDIAMHPSDLVSRQVHPSQPPVDTSSWLNIPHTNYSLNQVALSNPNTARSIGLGSFTGGYSSYPNTSRSTGRDRMNSSGTAQEMPSFFQDNPLPHLRNAHVDQSAHAQAAMLNFYSNFWKKVYMLFFCVCSPTVRTEECLHVIEDLVLYMAQEELYNSPMLALALDSVVQRAMYELSDKTYKCSTDTEEPLDDSGNQNYDQKSSSVTSIHGCIAVMKQLVLPLFNKFMDDFFLHTFHPEGLQGNQLNQSATSQQSQQQFPLFTVSEKTQTLNRQLQELLSWSSICGQPRSGETYAANTVRFQLNQNAKRSTAGEVDGDVSSMSDSSSTVSSVTEANKKSGTDDGINEVNTSQVEDSRTAKLSALKLPIANISHQGDSYSAPVSARMIPAEELDLNIRAILAEVSSSSNVNSALNSATVETASMKLYHCLQSNLSEYITVNLCGSSALGLTEFDLKKVELDFAALVDPGENNFHSLTLQQKRMAMQQHLQLKLELRKLENIVEHQGIVESALKHVKACMKDLASTSTNFFVRLQSSVDKMLSNPEEHVMKHAEYYFLQRQQLTSPRVQTPRGASYASPRENFADGGGYTSRTSTGFEGGCPPGALNMDRNYWMRLLLAIKEDIELLRSSHDAAVDFYSLYCNGYSQSLNSTAVVQRYDAVREAIEAADNEKSQSIRKALKACEKLFKDAGFLNVRTVLNKTRFLHLKYSIPLENLRDVVQCSLFMSNLLPIQSTDLIHAYISLDKTGKVKDYLRIIRLFVKYHQICDATYGYLTTYAWMVMALHVLLRFELIPNIHSNFIYRCDNDSQWRLFYGELDLTKPYYLDGSSRDPSIEDENAPHNLLPNSARPKLDSDAVQYSDMPRSSYADTFLSTRVTDPQFQLPESYRDRLANTGLFEMLDLFFRYYVEQFDVYRSIVSLKGQGEILKKTDWTNKPGPVLWRISIEDPFDHICSIRPHDLGSTLSRPGQLTTFKALRRAVYGVRSIVLFGRDALKLNMRKFFSRSELIPLARKSDYLGAVVTLPPSWIGIAEKAARRGESDDTAKSTVEDGYLLKPNPNPMLRSSGLFATAAQVLKESQGPSSNGQGLTGLDYSNDIALTPRTLLDSHAARLHSPQTSFSYPEISVSDAFSLSKPKFDNIIATQQSASNIPGSGISVASTNSKGNVPTDPYEYFAKHDRNPAQRLSSFQPPSLNVDLLQGSAAIRGAVLPKEQLLSRRGFEQTSNYPRGYDNRSQRTSQSYQAGPMAPRGYQQHSNLSQGYQQGSYPNSSHLIHNRYPAPNDPRGYPRRSDPRSAVKPFQEDFRRRPEDSYYGGDGAQQQNKVDMHGKRLEHIPPAQFAGESYYAQGGISQAYQHSAPHRLPQYPPELNPHSSQNFNRAIPADRMQKFSARMDNTFASEYDVQPGAMRAEFPNAYSQTHHPMERRDAQPRYEGDAFLPSYNARMQSVGFSQPQQDFSSRAVDQRTSSNSVNGTDQYYSSQYYNRSEEQLQQRSVHQGQVYPSTRSAPPPQLPSYTMPKPPTYDYRGAH